MAAVSPIAAAAEQAATQPHTTAFTRGAAFVSSARAAAADGLTWSEFGELLVSLLRLMIGAYDGVTGMDGVAKKLAVTATAAQLFDALADKCVPVVAWPVWLLIRTPVRMIVLALAGGAVEALLPLTRRSAA